MEIDANIEFPDIHRWNNFWSQEAEALPDNLPRSVRNGLVRFSKAISEQGYDTDGELLSGTVGSGASDINTVNLEAGVEYAIIAVCDEECTDIDLRISDRADATLAEDVNPDDNPIIEFTAPSSGAYQLDMIMFSCGADSCGWAGQILKRP